MSETVLSNTLYNTELPWIAFREKIVITKKETKTTALTLGLSGKIFLLCWFKCVLGSIYLPPRVVFLVITLSSSFASGG